MRGRACWLVGQGGVLRPRWGAESGRDGMIQAAAKDGSSVVCDGCGGVIKRTR